MEQEQVPVKQKSKNRLIIAIIIFVALVILGGGYYAYAKVYKKTSSIIKEVATNTTLNPICKYNDPDLCKFINNWKDLKYMTMKTTSTAKDGKVTSWTMKTEGENNSQMTSEENGNENYNTITIGNTTYTKDYADNKWFKYVRNETDDTTTSIDNNIDFDEKADQVEDKTTYQKIGQEGCGKYTCFKYKVVDPSNTETTEYIYFDNKEYQLRKTRSEDKDGTISESTLDYSKINISEPSPTKEGDPYSSATINSTSQSDVSSEAIDSSTMSNTTSDESVDTANTTYESESTPIEE